jgi:hypothetical protein
MFGVPVVTNSCAYLTAHEAAGAQSIRHSLRPLDFEGHELAKLGQIVPRERGAIFSSSCPRLARASTSCLPSRKKDVDGRVKPGHDGIVIASLEPVIGPRFARTRWLAMTAL